MPISTINQNGLNAPLTLTAPVFSGNVTATTITSPAATALTLQSAGTTAVTINTSQNVGIGTTTPSGKLHTFQSAAQDSTVQFEAGTAGYASNLNLIANTAPGGAYNNITSFSGSSAEWRIGGSGNNSTIVFSTGSGYTERMRITSGGDLLVGTTTTNGLITGIQASTSAYAGYFTSNYTASNNANIMLWGRSGGAVTAAVRYKDASTSLEFYSPTGHTVAYTTSSDYRLKENVTPMTGALEKVTKLKPVTYTWKNGFGIGNGEGFIAHELQAVVPDAVTGEKDAVELVDVKDEEGNVIGQEEKPVYQGIDTSFLVATLTAAIQELKAEFDAYKASHP